jgi:hypothetical protein
LKSTTDNFWAFYQKFLSFEEPAEKWLHIIKAANQLAPSYLGESRNHYLTENHAEDHSMRLLNVLVAYEEGKHFYSHILAKLKDLDKYLPAEGIQYWHKTAEVDLSLASWLTLAEIYWPDWQKVFDLQRQDKRLEFLFACQKAISNTDLNWHNLLKIFEQQLSSYRGSLVNDFLPSAIMLVEGPTEEFLLPYLALNYGLNLNQQRIMLVASGGANKVLRKYLYWKNTIDLPIICLFDADATNIANTLMSDLRKEDNVFILDGEIEDLIQLDFLVDNINKYLEEDLLNDESHPVSTNDFDSPEKRTVILDKIWRQKELGKFEKVKFAKFITNQPDNMKQEFITTAAKDIFNKLEKTLDLQKNESTK